jgi:hypothetical protein
MAFRCINCEENYRRGYTEGMDAMYEKCKAIVERRWPAPQIVIENAPEWLLEQLKASHPPREGGEETTG